MHAFSTSESKSGSSLPGIIGVSPGSSVIPHLYTSTKMTSCGQQGLHISQGLAGSSIACLSHEPTLTLLAEAGSNVPTLFLSQTLALSTLPCSPLLSGLLASVGKLL